MTLRLKDILLKIDDNYEGMEYFEEAYFTMNPHFHKQTSNLEMNLHLSKVLPYNLYDTFIKRMQLATKAKIKLTIECDDPQVTLMQLSDYIQHFVGIDHRLQVFKEMLPTLEEKRILYHVADKKLMEDAIVNKYILEDSLKQCGIKLEILIKAIQPSQEVLSVKVKTENKIKEVFEDKKDYQQFKRSKKEYTSMKLIQVSESMMQIEVCGVIFDQELREMRNGKLMQTLYLADDEDAILLKRFERGALSAEKLKEIKVGDYVRVCGNVDYDSYIRELVLNPDKIEVINRKEREDNAPLKRVELHLHTKLSEMDGVCDVSEYIKQADKWGWDAIALCDHRVVQAFPTAQNTLAGINKKREKPMKVLYGIEMNMIDPYFTIVRNPNDTELEKGRYCIFDLETTGLSNQFDHIIEFGAQIMENRTIVDSLQLFIKPPRQISAFTTNLTNITNEDLRNALTFEEAAEQILNFIGDSILVAHNATFDYGFLNAELVRCGRQPLMNPVIDTLDLARNMLERKNYRLGGVARAYNITYDEDVAHRADYDAQVLAQVFMHMLNNLKHVKTLNDLACLQDQDNLFKVRDKHVTILVKNMAGLKELFELVTISHTTQLSYNKKSSSAIAEAKIWRNEILKRKLNGNLLIGSSCSNGEIFDLASTQGKKEVLEAMKFYDYIEIQPLENYRYLIDRNSIEDETRLKQILMMIIECANELGKIIVASSDAHHVHPNEKQLRDIYINAQAIGGIRHPLYIYDKDKRRVVSSPNQYMRTTNEMLQAFNWLGEEKAYEYVITNTRKIADMIEVIYPVKSKLYPPDIEGSDQLLRDICFENAHKRYGPNLPEIVEKRLNRELDSIIGAGYYVVYYISHLLVKKSLDDGYLVGSRGSVGSSFVATMSEITEVNPLAPHYVCPKCHYTKFFEDGSVPNGYDLPDISCPNCGTIIRGDGHDIPFETFLGFEGDKVPDIDLNFSGEYQPNAHAYTKEVFGEDHVFRAGTTGTVAEKTAFGYIKGYEEEMGSEGSMRNARMTYLAKKCEGVKRTTGQHPGGIVVVPLDLDVHDFTPVQYPANDPHAEWKTTHFDFHQIHDNILKFDILGHVDPTAMKMLERMSGIDVTTIPMNDPETMSIFSSIDALKIDSSKTSETTGAAGIPEFGTPFVRGILSLTKPTTFDELLKISGLSHGTDVWLGNAKDLIENGTCTLKSVIGCRDDIMVYLLHKGLKPKSAFTIMESVRKGKGLKDEWIVEMKENGVEDWYIESCKKIKYMFPKAHAVAYVMMAIRIAWFKVHQPQYYYCMFFSIRCDAYDIETMIQGEQSIRYKMSMLDAKFKDPKMKKEVTKKDKDTYSTLELALEMVLRGYYFTNIDLNRSAAKEFIVDKERPNYIIPPFTSIDGLGENVALSIVEAREKEPFLSKQDLLKRTGLSTTLCKKLESMGVLEGLQEENQLSLF